MASSRIELHAAPGSCHGTLVRQESRPAGPLLAFVHGGGCASRYFEAPKVSPASLAEAAGFHLLLIDRPGHGLSGSAAAERPIESSLEPIRSVLRTALDAVPECRDLFMIGHSIGGAVALMLAADHVGLPLRGIAVSGIGDEPPAATLRWAEAEPFAIDLVDEIASAFFGEAGTFDWRGPAQLRRAAEPWNPEEVREIVRDWPRRWPEIAARIATPVHYRLADHDGIWVSGSAVVERFARAMTRSPAVDADRLTEGGHVYEYHLKGPELVASQLDFFSRLTTGGSHTDRSTPVSA